MRTAHDTETSATARISQADKVEYTERAHAAMEHTPRFTDPRVEERGEYGVERRASLLRRAVGAGLAGVGGAIALMFTSGPLNSAAIATYFYSVQPFALATGALMAVCGAAMLLRG